MSWVETCRRVFLTGYCADTGVIARVVSIKQNLCSLPFLLTSGSVFLVRFPPNTMGVFGGVVCFLNQIFIKYINWFMDFAFKNRTAELPERRELCKPVLV